MASVIKYTMRNQAARNMPEYEEMFDYEIYINGDNEPIARFTPEIEREDAFDYHRRYALEMRNEEGHWQRWGGYVWNEIKDADDWMLDWAEEQFQEKAFLYDQTEDHLKERFTEQYQVVWWDDTPKAKIYACDLIKDKNSPIGEAWHVRSYWWDAHKHSFKEGEDTIYHGYNSATEALYALRDEDDSHTHTTTTDLQPEDWDYFKAAIGDNDLVRIDALVEACKGAELRPTDTERYGLDSFFHILPKAQRLELVEKFIDNGLTSKQLVLAQNSSLNALLDPEYTQTPNGFIDGQELMDVYYAGESYSLREREKFIDGYLQKLPSGLKMENVSRVQKAVENSLEELNWLAGANVLYPSFDVYEGHVKAMEEPNGICKGQYVHNSDEGRTFIKSSMIDYEDARRDYEKEVSKPHEYKIKAAKEGLDNVYYDMNYMKFSLYDKEGYQVYDAVIARDTHLPDEVRKAMEIHSAEQRKDPYRYRPLRTVLEQVKAEKLTPVGFDLEAYLGNPTRRSKEHNAALGQTAQTQNHNRGHKRGNNNA